jgi:DNA-binding MarR family transcriptional regulator
LRTRRPAAASKRPAARAVAPNPLPIDRSPFFKLLLLVNLTGRPFGRLYGRRYKLNLTEWRVMITLASKPGSTGNDIAHYTGLDKMSVSRAVRGLMQRGRVVRRADPHDRRNLLLELSAAGLALFQTIAVSGGRREQDLMSALDAKERRQFAALLGKLVARARAMPNGDGAGD